MQAEKVKNNKLYPHNAYQAKELTMMVKARAHNCKPKKLKTTNFIHTMHQFFTFRVPSKRIYNKKDGVNFLLRLFFIIKFNIYLSFHICKNIYCALTVFNFNLFILSAKFAVNRPIKFFIRFKREFGRFKQNKFIRFQV